MNYLYKRDSKGKIRVFRIWTTWTDDPLSGHINIKRSTGVLGGKILIQPTVVVEKGKVKRTVEQQVELQVNSMISKQKDKGYKSFEDLTAGINLIGRIDAHEDYAFIDSLLPVGESTYAEGEYKQVMLALDPKTKKNFNWNQEWLISKKLDGIRCSIHTSDKGKTFKAISRRGKDISPAFQHIFADPELKKLAKVLDYAPIDGELYCHGMSLQEISGISRLDEFDKERNTKLQLWVFDYMHDTDTAEERITKLRSFESKSDDVVMVAHVKLNNWNSIKTIHDKWVEQGFEGAIARLATSTYQYGKKNNNMVKVKLFQDDEFEIIGHKLGLRGAEDMCFICKTKDDKQFEAKPMGAKELKEEYVNNIHNLIGKQLTVKFFNYTDDGIPFLPVGKAIRDYE